MSSVMIACEDVRKTFRIGNEDIEVLRGISLQVQQGEFICIMGPSGSGKSTLLNILSSIEDVSKGLVKLAGKDVTHFSERELVEVRRNISSMIFQDFNLLPYQSALENVMFPMMLNGVGEKEAYERAINLLSLVDLADRVNHAPDDLSGGQQQRVAIARALANNPQVLLADEPTGNLDSHTGQQIIDLFKRLVHERGLTVILVTHDLAIAKQTDRILILREGTLHSEEAITNGLNGRNEQQKVEVD